MQQLGGLLCGFIRSSNLTTNVDPSNEAALMNHQDSMAHASMMLNQSVRHQSDVAFRNQIQREVGDAPTSIPTEGRWDGPWEPVSRFEQIHSEELLARQLEQEERQSSATASSSAATSSSEAAMVHPKGRCVRQNGLSNQAVDATPRCTVASSPHVQRA